MGIVFLLPSTIQGNVATEKIGSKRIRMRVLPEDCHTKRNYLLEFRERYSPGHLTYSPYRQYIHTYSLLNPMHLNPSIHPSMIHTPRIDVHILIYQNSNCSFTCYLRVSYRIRGWSWCVFKRDRSGLWRGERERKKVFKNGSTDGATNIPRLQTNIPIGEERGWGR